MNTRNFKNLTVKDSEMNTRNFKNLTVKDSEMNTRNFKNLTVKDSEMNTVKFKGQVVKQRDKVLFVGSISVKELLRIYKIDIWNISDSIEKRGIQRSPIPAHFKKIGKSLSNPDVSFPTAVVLSSDITNDSKKSNKFSNVNLPKGMKVTYIDSMRDFVNIEINPEQLKFQVVDGQHRIKGIEFALDRGILSSEETFDLPYVLILTKNRYEQIQNFYSINSKAKRVATDLALQLMNEMENSDPNYTLSLSEKKKVIAVNIIEALNMNTTSVWFKNISQGNIAAKDEIISSTSFVTSLLPVLTIPFFNNEIKNLQSGNNEIQNYGKDKAKLINNFWEALRHIMPSAFEEKTEWVIQKTPGVYILHKVFAQVIDKYFIQKNQVDLGVDAIEKFFKEYGTSYISEKEVNFWKAAKDGSRGGMAATANSSQAFKSLSDEILEDIDNKYEEKQPTVLRY